MGSVDGQGLATSGRLGVYYLLAPSGPVSYSSPALQVARRSVLSALLFARVYLLVPCIPVPELLLLLLLLLLGSGNALPAKRRTPDVSLAHHHSSSSSTALPPFLPYSVQHTFLPSLRTATPLLGGGRVVWARDGGGGGEPLLEARPRGLMPRTRQTQHEEDGEDEPQLCMYGSCLTTALPVLP